MGGEIEIMECRDSRKFSRDVMPYSPPSVAVSSFSGTFPLLLHLLIHKLCYCLFPLDRISSKSMDAILKPLHVA